MVLRGVVEELSCSRWSQATALDYGVYEAGNEDIVEETEAASDGDGRTSEEESGVLVDLSRRSVSGMKAKENSSGARCRWLVRHRIDGSLRYATPPSCI